MTWILYANRHAMERTSVADGSHLRIRDVGSRKGVSRHDKGIAVKAAV